VRKDVSKLAVIRVRCRSHRPSRLPKTALGSLAHVCSYPPDLETEWFCGLKTRYA